jgi:hypothetical protein
MTYLRFSPWMLIPIYTLSVIWCYFVMITPVV